MPRTRYVELTLFGVGTALLLVYATAQTDAALGRQQALEAFQIAQLQATNAGPGETQNQEGGNPVARVDDPAHPDQTLWAESRIKAYRASLDRPAGVPEGVLRIPAIGLTVPIFAGTSELSLNRGVGWIDDTASLGTQGNVGIAGHRDGYFRGLKDLAIGDVVEVATLSDSQRYRIVELLIVEPTDVHVLDPTPKPTLTLVTCYPFYFVGHAPQRYIVRGVLDDTTIMSER